MTKQLMKPQAVRKQRFKSRNGENKISKRNSESREEVFRTSSLRLGAWAAKPLWRIPRALGRSHALDEQDSESETLGWRRRRRRRRGWRARVEDNFLPNRASSSIHTESNWVREWSFSRSPSPPVCSTYMWRNICLAQLPTLPISLFFFLLFWKYMFNYQIHIRSTSKMKNLTHIGCLIWLNYLFL